LCEEAEQKIVTLGKKHALGKAFVIWLYSSLKMDATAVAEALDINISTANRLIDDFFALNILTEVTGFKRNRIFSFEEYIKVFR
jgi:hypothetical protein